MENALALGGGGTTAEEAAQALRRGSVRLMAVATLPSVPLFLVSMEVSGFAQDNLSFSPTYEDFKMRTPLPALTIATRSDDANLKK